MTVNIFSTINEYKKQIPVDVEELAKALGIEVNYAHLGNDVSGMIERIKDKNYLITINADDPKTRQRFTLAHELGHFVYHKDKMGDGIDDDRIYRSTNVGKHHNTRIGANEETQANKFAANLLMPWSLISDLQDKKVTKSDDIAKHLGVSKHAICIRLGIPHTI